MYDAHLFGLKPTIVMTGSLKGMYFCCRCTPTTIKYRKSHILHVRHTHTHTICAASFTSEHRFMLNVQREKGRGRHMRVHWRYPFAKKYVHNTPTYTHTLHSEASLARRMLGQGAGESSLIMRSRPLRSIAMCRTHERSSTTQQITSEAYFNSTKGRAVCRWIGSAQCAPFPCATVMYRFKLN